MTRFVLVSGRPAAGTGDAAAGQPSQQRLRRCCGWCSFAGLLFGGLFPLVRYGQRCQLAALQVCPP